MSVAVYTFADGGAPQLGGSAGTLISVLDFALVTGSGWTKPYSGANKAVYRPPSGNQFYLRVDDSGLDAPVGGSARVTAYESMTTVDVGTNPFPSAAQGQGSAGYILWHKNMTVAGTGGAWRMVVTDTFMWLWVRAQTNTTSGTGFVVSGFGDVPSKKSGDAFNTIILGSLGATYVGSYLQTAIESTIPTVTPAAAGAIFIARQQDQTGTSQAIRLVPFESNKVSGGKLSNTTVFTNPHVPDGKMFFSTLEIAEKPGANAYWRGTLPGIYILAGMGNALFGDDIQFVVGGKTLLASRISTTTAAWLDGWVLFEVSNTW